MAQVMVALYDDYGVADRVRSELVEEGFPTSRVELTALVETGQADAQPGDSVTDRIANYFTQLFEADEDDEREYAEFFTESVRRGGAVITVHPRSEEEIMSAQSILQRHGPVDIEARRRSWQHS